MPFEKLEPSTTTSKIQGTSWKTILKFTDHIALLKLHDPNLHTFLNSIKPCVDHDPRLEYMQPNQVTEEERYWIMDDGMK